MRQNLMVESKYSEWTKKEDERLLALHHSFQGNWEKICAELGDKRNKSECKQRLKQIGVAELKGAWKPKED